MIMKAEDIKQYLESKLDMVKHNKNISSEKTALLWYEAQEDLLDGILLAIR